MEDQLFYDCISGQLPGNCIFNHEGSSKPKHYPPMTKPSNLSSSDSVVCISHFLYIYGLREVKHSRVVRFDDETELLSQENKEGPFLHAWHIDQNYKSEPVFVKNDIIVPFFGEQDIPFFEVFLSGKNFRTSKVSKPIKMYLRHLGDEFSKLFPEEPYQNRGFPKFLDHCLEVDKKLSHTPQIDNLLDSIVAIYVQLYFGYRTFVPNKDDPKIYPFDSKSNFIKFLSLQKIAHLIKIYEYFEKVVDLDGVILTPFLIHNKSKRLLSGVYFNLLDNLQNELNCHTEASNCKFTEHGLIATRNIYHDEKLISDKSINKDEYRILKRHKVYTENVNDVEFAAYNPSVDNEDLQKLTWDINLQRSIKSLEDCI